MSLSSKVTWLLVAVLGLSLLTVGGYAVSEQESLAQDLMREWVSQCSSRYLEILGQALNDSDFDRVIKTGKALVTGMPVGYCEIITKHGDVAFKEGFKQENSAVSFVWPVPYSDAMGIVQTVGRLTLVLSPGPMTVAVSRIGQTISLAGAGTLLLGMLLGGLAIRSMLGLPMKRLVKGVNCVVNQGDLQHEIEVDRHDEIGVLAHAINTLTHELQGLLYREQALTHCVDQEHQRALVLHESLNQDESDASEESALAMMKDMIERSGGQFWVKSEEGKPRVFHFTLPQKIAASDFEKKEVCR